jgi:Tol biopolymer transport system component
MSPEQAQGKKIDARSDIFNFGAVIYKMVTGRQAFHGDSKMSTLAAVLNKDPKPASEITSAVPRDLEKIINRCLRKDPTRRWQTMADLKVALEELKEESDSDVLTAAGGADPWSTKARRVSPLQVMGIAVVAIALVAAGWFWLGPSGAAQPEASLTAVPLTTYTGWEGMPAFSPDGNQVAFAWNGENQDNWDVCVKFLEEGPAHRLTDHPANDYSPAWSLDGRRIAFCRAGPENFAIYFVSPLGGTERKLADLNTASWWRRQLSWSPDGKRIAFHDRDRSDGHFRIFLLDVETRDRRSLRIDSTEVPDHLSPAFSPDGQTLAFIGEKAAASVADIYLVSTNGGAPRRLTSDNRFIGGLAWTPDGREIIFSSGAGVSDALLWSIRLSDGRRKPLAELGEGALVPAVSRDSLRLAYTRATWDSNIWRFDTRGRTPPKKLIESTRADENPSFSTDGKHIAFVSERSGSNELWLCDGDGLNPVRLTSFGGPVIGWPAWSPDRRQIAFDSNKIGNYDIYVISVEGGAPRPLTTHSGLDARPRWSSDGRWIYFQSDRGGTTDIWKMPAGGGRSPVQVTENGGHSPFVSVDGRFVYYSKGRGSVWRVPAQGGEETLVFEDVPPSIASDWFHWVPAENGIYFVDQESNKWSVKLVPFGAGRAKHVFDVERPAGSAPAISPDGRWLLYAQFDQVRRDLMLVENFR